MLRVDIRDLQRGPVRTVGELAPEDPTFEGLGLDLVGPVTVQGQLQATGDGEYLWRGDLHGVVRGECRRCLTEVIDEVDVEVDAAVFTSDPEAADDPDFYPLPERAAAVTWPLWSGRSSPSLRKPTCSFAETIVPGSAPSAGPI